jgi:chromosome segregation ATPase
MWLLLVSQQVQQAGSSDLALILSIVVGALFGTGGLVAFFTVRNQNRKLRAEASKLDFDRTDGTLRQQISLAQGAVVVQSGVIKDLQDQLKQQRRMIEDQSAALVKERTKHERYREHAEADRNHLQELISDLQDSYSEVLHRLDAITLERDGFAKLLREASAP